MLYKQFHALGHDQFQYYFINVTRDSSSYIGGPNLFGGTEYMHLYTSNFKLELIYG